MKTQAAYRLLFPFLLPLLALAACKEEAVIPPPASDPSCRGLYGSPNGSTGLDADACFPRIEGAVTWTPRAWDASAFADLRAWTLDATPAVPTENPYEVTPDLQPDPYAVCAVLVTGEHRYRLETFREGSVKASVALAEAAGGRITHGGACGLCSSLADLEVYARIPDQTDPVRGCAASNLGGPVEDVDACIQESVGFTPPCSRIWAYNAINDGEHCRTICLTSLLEDEPYNLPDGSLNACLQCDEDVSGPVFKAMAGRTRRNSGLAAAICRPCETVWRIDHRYP